MTAFIRTAADVREAGEPWAVTDQLDSYYSRFEGGLVELVHRAAGYDPKGATFTRWLPEQWGIRWPSGAERWFDAKADATMTFNTLKREGE